MKVKPLHPLISCICITNNRPEMLLKSILAFDQQNYPNIELIISYPTSDTKTKALVAEVVNINPINIQTIERGDQDSIGSARNQAVSISSGEYVCMWDDDDIYFHTRIADQHNLLQGSGRYFQSSVIKQVILFDIKTIKAYVSQPSYWTGTLLCKRKHFLDYPCPDANEFECTPVIDFLKSRRLMLQTELMPNLYVYVYHGSNIIDHYNFQYLIRKGSPLHDSYAQNINNYIQQKVQITLP